MSLLTWLAGWNRRADLDYDDNGAVHDALMTHAAETGCPAQATDEFIGLDYPFYCATCGAEL